MHIHLNIETLILRNIPYEQRHAIRAAVEEELQRLLGETGSSLVQGADMPHLSIAPLSVPTGARPATIGALIARQVYHVLYPPTSRRRDMPSLNPDHTFKLYNGQPIS